MFTRYKKCTLEHIFHHTTEGVNLLCELEQRCYVTCMIRF